MERNGAGFRKTPAPIFSKKPRQALLAHPNNLNSTNDLSGTYSGNRYKPTESSGRSFQQRSFADTNKGSTIEKTGCYSYGGGGNDLNTFSNVGNTNQFQKSLYQKPATSYNRSKSQSTTFQSQSSIRNPSHIRQDPYSNNPPPVSSRTPLFHEPRQSMPASTQFRPINNNSQAQASSYGQYASNSYSGPGPGGQTANPSPMKGVPPYGQASLPQYHASAGIGSNRTHPTAGDYSSQQSTQHPSAHQKKMPPAKQSVAASKTDAKTEKKELDCSIRLITTSVQGVKHWAQYSNKLSLIFEVFGYLDSAVSAEDKSSARRFRLKDEKDCMDCMFFQIDRALPNMMRGRWYRCVGRWTARGERLQCLSVREASEDERSVYKLKINSSDRAMREWRVRHSEF